MARKNCWRAIVVCLVLGLGTIALYSPAFGFHFVNHDDQVYVTANPLVNHGLNGKGLRWAFQTFYTGNWQPLTWLSHMVDCQIYGAKAGGHHATNIVLHALSSVILFLALARMTGVFWRSAAVAAFFAWHPLQVESVAWIAERKDVLGGFFWLLALWAYVRYAQNFKSQTNFRLFYALAVVFFALGLMVKPMLIMMPCILLLLDWWPLGRFRSGVAPADPHPGPLPEGKGKLGLTEEKTAPATAGVAFVLSEKIPFFLLSIASCIVAAKAGGHETVSSPMGRLSFNHRLVTVGVSYFRYLEKTIWPSDLGPLYPMVFHQPKVELIAIALFLLGVTVVAIRLRNSRPYWLAGWLWFVGMLVPTLNLFHTNAQPMADRCMYLPSIGLFILICWEAADLSSQWPAGRTVLGILCGLALAGCCVASSFQLQYWKNEGALLSRIAEPRINYFGHANYASYLMNHNQLTEAQAECETAINILPDYAPFNALLGEIFLLEHKYDDAIQQFRQAQKLDPRMVGIHLLWGRALLAEKRADAAASEFKTVISADPKSPEAHNLLAATYVILGKTSEAIQEFRSSLASQPNQPEMLNDLAWILATNPNADVRNGTDAVKFAAQACGLTHSAQPVFLGTLAAAYAEAARFDDAIATAQQAHDVAAARAAAAEKANEPAAARAEQALAARNLELLELYRSHKPFHEKAAR